jgi:hypothetical protein
MTLAALSYPTVMRGRSVDRTTARRPRRLLVVLAATAVLAAGVLAQRWRRADPVRPGPGSEPLPARSQECVGRAHGSVFVTARSEPCRAQASSRLKLSRAHLRRMGS